MCRLAWLPTSLAFRGQSLSMAVTGAGHWHRVEIRLAEGASECELRRPAVRIQARLSGATLLLRSTGCDVSRRWFSRLDYQALRPQ